MTKTELTNNECVCISIAYIEKKYSKLFNNKYNTYDVIYDKMEKKILINFYIFNETITFVYSIESQSNRTNVRSTLNDIFSDFGKYLLLVQMKYRRNQKLQNKY